MSQSIQFTLKEKPIQKSRRRSGGGWLWSGVIIFLLSAAWMIPAFSEYQSLQRERVEASQDIEHLQAEVQTLSETEKIKQSEKERLGKGHVEKESLLLPQHIESNRIASTLEILSLQLENLDAHRASHFHLESIRFSDDHSDPNAHNKQANLSFTSDKKNLEHLLLYLQKGIVPDIVYRGVSTGHVPRSTVQILEKETLPISTIDQLQINEGRKEDTFNIEMQITFYTK